MIHKPFPNPIRNILDDFIESQGWDDESTITLLCDFLDSANINVNPDRFRAYLRERVESEIQETK